MRFVCASLAICLTVPVLGAFGQSAGPNKASPFQLKSPNVSIPPPPLIPEVRQLHASSSVNLSSPPFGFFGHAQCDSDGNLYFRIGKIPEYNKTEILRLSPSHRDPVYYTLPTKYSGTVSYDGFEVMPDGDLYILADDSHDTWYLFHWSRSASEPEETRLEFPAGLSADRFAVMSDERILISGVYGPQASKILKGKTFAGEYSPAGDLIREFHSFAHDTKNVDDGVPAMEMGAAMDEGGMLYYPDGDKIRVYTSAAESVRTITPVKPSPDATMTIVRAANHRLAVWFRTLSKTMKGRFTIQLEIIDPVSGDPIALYEPDESLNSESLCFTGTAFLFMDMTRDHQLRLITADIE